MISLIKNAVSLGLSYCAYALSNIVSSYTPDKGFDDDGVYYHSLRDVPNQWWQVSFSVDVAILQYIIKTTKTNNNRLNSWVINASFDNKTWETVHTVPSFDTGGNDTPLTLPKTVKCRHFRIVAKGNSSGNNVLHFTYFDCFGKLSTSSTNCKCTKLCVYLSYKLFFNVFLSSFSISFT